MAQALIPALSRQQAFVSVRPAWPLHQILGQTGLPSSNSFIFYESITLRCCHLVLLPENLTYDQGNFCKKEFVWNLQFQKVRIYDHHGGGHGTGAKAKNLTLDPQS